jgi:hypothetical protein
MDFFNTIGTKRISRHVRSAVAIGVKAGIEKPHSANAIYESTA